MKLDIINCKKCNKAFPTNDSYNADCAHLSAEEQQLIVTSICCGCNEENDKLTEIFKKINVSPIEKKEP